MTSIGSADTLVFCSFRYALGRKSFVVSDVCKAIADNKGQIHRNTKMQMLDEINAAVYAGTAGMQMDVDEWLKLRAALVESL